MTAGSLKTLRTKLLASFPAVFPDTGACGNNDENIR
jgi:hypothetical protein